MFFYLGISSVSAIITRVAWVFFEQTNNKFLNRFFGILCLIAAASVFAFFAGSRNPDMTPDSIGYGTWSWNSAQLHNFHEFMNIFEWFTYAAGFIMWSVSRLTKSLFWLYFVVNFVLSFPTIVGCTLALKKYSWTGVIGFGVLLYPMSFNLMRQFMAHGFISLGIAFTLRKKPIPWAICTLIGAALHPSAFINVVIYPAYWYLSKKTAFPLFLKSIIILGVALSSTFVTQIFALIFTKGTAWDVYGDFTDRPTGGFFTLFLIILFLSFLFLLVFKKKTEQDTINLAFLMVLLGFSVVAFSLALQYDWLNRISYYFLISLIYLPGYLVISSDERAEKFLLLTVSLALVFLAGYVHNDLRESDHTVPYKFGHNFNFDYEEKQHVEYTDDISNYLF